MDGMLNRLWHDDLGTTTVEYALLVVVVVVSTMGAWSALSEHVLAAVDAAQGALTN
jgi:Flp pilus assembly pilin Flp